MLPAYMKPYIYLLLNIFNITNINMYSVNIGDKIRYII